MCAGVHSAVLQAGQHKGSKTKAFVNKNGMVTQGVPCRFIKVNVLVISFPKPARWRRGWLRQTLSVR